MVQSFKHILFATNLSVECRRAFQFAVSIATRYQAGITLLHVIENLPSSIESQLSGFIGEDQWERLLAEKTRSAREQLIGKRKDHELVEMALERFCEEARIGSSECGFQTEEIIVKTGDVVQEIINVAEKRACDIIVIGGHKGMMGKDTAISKITKGVIHQARSPVLLVPPLVI